MSSVLRSRFGLLGEWDEIFEGGAKPESVFPCARAVSRFRRFQEPWLTSLIHGRSPPPRCAFLPPCIISTYIDDRVDVLRCCVAPKGAAQSQIVPSVANKCGSGLLAVHHHQLWVAGADGLCGTVPAGRYRAWHAVVVLRTRASDALQYLTGLALRSFLTASAFPFLRAIVCADAVEVEEEEAEAPPEEEEENEG
eukprot:895998-Rhodomonas_salina.4